MRLKQGRSYSVEREVQVADEKKPDVRLRAKVTDASVPVEIKVVESWTRNELIGPRRFKPSFAESI